MLTETWSIWSVLWNLRITKKAEQHRREAGISSCSHSESMLNSFIKLATSSMSRYLLSSLHVLIYCLIITPNCFIWKEFVFTDYIIRFKGIKMLSSVYFPFSHSVVLKPLWAPESRGKFDNHEGGLEICISNKHSLRWRWSTITHRHGASCQFCTWWWSVDVCHSEVDSCTKMGGGRSLHFYKPVVQVLVNKALGVSHAE